MADMPAGAATDTAALPSLETLLAEGEVQSALLLKGDFTREEQRLIHEAYQAGIDHGRAAERAVRERAEDALRELHRYVWNEGTGPWPLSVEHPAMKQAREALKEAGDASPEDATTAEGTGS